MSNTTPHHPDTTTERAKRCRPNDSATLSADGYTRFDVVVVVVILAMLSAIVFFAVGGLRVDAAEPGCSGDRRALGTAADAYFVRHRSAAVPATGVGKDRYEQTLVDLGLIQAVSDLYDLDAAGAVIPEGESPC